MKEKLTIPHQKVKEKYAELYIKKSTSNKKNDLRQILESIFNALLLKYENIDIDKLRKEKKNPPDLVNRYKILKNKKILHERFEPAVFFLTKEGNMGSHANERSDFAGEDSYVDALIICVKPLIKAFFEDEEYSIDFLNSPKSEIQKKSQLLTIISSVLAVLFFSSMIYLFSMKSDITSKDKNIESLTDAQKQYKQDLKKKNYAIDSLKKVILVTESKKEINNGIKNEFNDKVKQVKNFNKVEKLDL